MQEKEVINILQKQLNFTTKSIAVLKMFVDVLINENKKHNFISKSTEADIWHRHVLDSAQLVKFIDFSKGSLSDLGSGAGFPGLVLAIFNSNKDFHVKLYEKSPVKRAFLNSVIDKIFIKATVYGNIYEENLDSDYTVCRAFKKLDTIIQVSREIAKKPHKLIILKGQNAQKEVNKALKKQKYPYKLESSMTSNQSKILIIDFNQ